MNLLSFMYTQYRTTDTIYAKQLGNQPIVASIMEVFPILRIQFFALNYSLFFAIYQNY